MWPSVHPRYPNEMILTLKTLTTKHFPVIRIMNEIFQMFMKYSKYPWVLWKSVWNIHDYSWNYGLNHLFRVFKWAGHHPGPLCPRALGNPWFWAIPPAGGAGAGAGAVPGVRRLGTSLVMECGTVSRKGCWALISYEVRNHQLELKDIGREQECLVTHGSYFLRPVSALRNLTKCR